MMRDVVELWKVMFGSSNERTPTLLVGHSMGGAVAVWAASTKEISSLDGCVVIDVVEGTALGEKQQRHDIRAAMCPYCALCSCGVCCIKFMARTPDYLLLLRPLWFLSQMEYSESPHGKA